MSSTDPTTAQTFRPTFGRWLTAAIWTLSVIALLSAFIQSPAAGLRAAPWLALLSGAVWAAYWRPQVAVDVAGVHLVNVLRTIDLPWPSIQRIDTKWALTLFTAYGKFPAWAAPAPGGMNATLISRRTGSGLPPSTFGPHGTIRPGDHPDSASGAAAAVVRRQWEELRDLGFLDDPRLEFSRPPIRLHRRTIVAGALLLLACAASALL
ncbi:PH domain-containing protein [Nakamurella sp. PAMC28650]|uniref:PH domain-containing protein n=1 Tax=Nakamurella sp. PAMC28650 TaxID=2762325 RepID=UPI00164E5EB8|nr:PH domain-containing protein [Nakamurella sp. PAMC28650]QNK80875.1 PH domain-containing protein [Nakamurella sp. PAMC28650]